MENSTCIFCKIVAGEIPATVLYEDEQVLSFLDIGPLSEGHALVIPKAHYPTVGDCPVELIQQVTGCLPLLTRAVKTAMQSDGYNVLCNNGRAAGQIVDHLHFHIVPRNEADSLFGRWPTQTYGPGAMDNIADRIRTVLTSK